MFPVFIPSSISAGSTGLARRANINCLGSSRIHTQDGRERWVVVNAIPVFGRDGCFAGYAGTDADAAWIKARERELEESREKFRRIVDLAPVLLWTTGVDGRVGYFNRFCLDFRGRTLEQEIGTGWLEGMHPDDLEQSMRSYLSAYAEHRPFRAEFRLRRADGEYRWVLDNATPCFDASGAFTGYIGSSVDITENKVIEAALRESVQLADELTLKAQAATRAKSEFLAVMSHELRTPLNGVLGFAELLADTPLDDRQKSYLATITTSGSHLLDVVNEILDFSSIERGVIRIAAAAVPLSPLLESACLASKKAALDKGLDFSCEISPREEGAEHVGDFCSMEDGGLGEGAEDGDVLGGGGAAGSHADFPEGGCPSGLPSASPAGSRHTGQPTPHRAGRAWVLKT